MNKGRASTLKALMKGSGSTNDSKSSKDNKTQKAHDNPTKKDSMCKNANKAVAADEKYLLPLSPYLESLPAPELQHPAKELASSILVNAISLRHKKEALDYLKNSPKTPRPAHFGFKLKSSSVTVKATKEFKNMAKECEHTIKNMKKILTKT